MVAVAVGALYGGLGPGLLGLGLAVVVARDPVVLAAGGALLALYVTFRRSRSVVTPTEDTLAAEPVPESPPGRFERLEAAPPGFAPEVPRITPAFAEVTTEATWRFQHEQPLDITLPEDEQ